MAISAALPGLLGAEQVGHPSGGDPAGVSAEGGDVVLDPAERGDLVQEPAVGRRSGEVPEALGAQAVVEGHHDDAVTGQGGGVEEGSPDQP
jgi:hypothetical protein